jgi:hypothetical protein
VIHPSSGTKGLSIVDTWTPSRRRRNQAENDDQDESDTGGTRSAPDRSRKRFLATVRVPGTTRYLAKRFDDRKPAEQWGDSLLARLKAGTETADKALLDEVCSDCRSN